MWQTIFLQVITCGVFGASLFLKSQPDFENSISYILFAVMFVSGVVSILIFKNEETDNKFLRRSIENIVRSIRLNEYIYGVIKAGFSKAAPIGYPATQCVSLGEGAHSFVFWTVDESTRGGAVLVLINQMNQFAMYDEGKMEERIFAFTRENLSGSLDDCWNVIVEELRLSAVYILIERGLDPVIARRVWVDFDKKNIGFSTNVRHTEPDVHFTRKELVDFMKLNRINRHCSMISAFSYKISET